jgi:hypothetical protein
LVLPVGDYYDFWDHYIVKRNHEGAKVQMLLYKWRCLVQLGAASWWRGCVEAVNEEHKYNMYIFQAREKTIFHIY